MSNAGDLADSTDWLSTPLATLAPIENSLRCQVCKDFYATPMITSCSHTFCSLCIRRYLSQEGKCPSCREPDQEIKLRRNWVVEELVEKFQAGRSDMLRFARSSMMTDGDRPTKRRKLARTSQEPERRSTRSHSKRLAAKDNNSPPTAIDLQDSDEGSVYDDEPESSMKYGQEIDDGLVQCPICSKRMKEAAINTHLDSCIGNDATINSSPRRSATPQHPAKAIAHPQPKSSVTRERLPTINYSMLNDNALRKKLKDLGILSTGSKETMRKRHTEWINLWNANCDAKDPASKQELLRSLQQWERSAGRQIDRGPSGVMIKDFDRDAWQQSNKSDFDDLIRRAREKKVAVHGPPALSTDTESMVEEDSSKPKARDVPLPEHAQSDTARGPNPVEADSVPDLTRQHKLLSLGQSSYSGEPANGIVCPESLGMSATRGMNGRAITAESVDQPENFVIDDLPS